jgi:hypothetical protein
MKRRNLNNNNNSSSFLAFREKIVAVVSQEDLVTYPTNKMIEDYGPLAKVKISHPKSVKAKFVLSVQTQVMSHPLEVGLLTIT